MAINPILLLKNSSFSPCLTAPHILIPIWAISALCPSGSHYLSTCLRLIQKKCRSETGEKDGGDGQNRKRGWGWPLGVKVEVREKQESGNLSLGFDQLLEGAIQIYYRMAMTKPGPGGQRNLYHSMQSFKRHLLWGGGESENVGGMSGWGQIKGSREGTAQATLSVKGTEAQGRERAWSRRTSSSASSIMELAAPCSQLTYFWILCWGEIWFWFKNRFFWRRKLEGLQQQSSLHSFL